MAVGDTSGRVLDGLLAHRQLLNIRERKNTSELKSGHLQAASSLGFDSVFFYLALLSIDST